MTPINQFIQIVRERHFSKLKSLGEAHYKGDISFLIKTIEYLSEHCSKNM